MVRKTPRKFSVIAIGNIIWYNYRIMAEGSDDTYGVQKNIKKFYVHGTVHPYDIV